MARLRKLLRLQPDLAHVAHAVNINRFGSGLVSVFIPLIVIRDSPSPHQAIEILAAFYLASALCKMAVNVPAMLAINRWGAPPILGGGFVVGAGSLLALLAYTGDHSAILLLGCGLLTGAAGALSDDARHVYISGSVEHEGISSSMATMEMTGQGLDVAAPLIGAAVGTLLGPGWLVGAALALMASSVVPLARMHKVDRSRNSERPRFSLGGAPRRDVVSNICFTADEALGDQLWPIWLAVVLGSFTGIGAVTAIAASVTVLTIYMAGHLGDKGHDRMVLRHGIAGVGVSNVLRFASHSPLMAGVVSAAYGGTREFALNGLNSIVYANARRRGIQYVTTMQMACDIGYSSIWAVVLAVALLTQGTTPFFYTAFALAAVLIWGTPLITQQASSGEGDAWAGAGD
jgi:hypothetical protein